MQQLLNVFEKSCQQQTLQENSQEHPSLQQVQEAPEGLVCQVVQQVQQCQAAPFHQETPRKGQEHAQYDTD